LNLFISGLDFQVNYAFDTDFGEIEVGDSITEFTQFDQQVGNGGSVFSVLNTNGFNQTFPSVQTQMRASLGWHLDGFGANMYVNYTGSYRNWGSTSVRPILRDASGLPTEGGDKVDSNTTVDLHLSYDFDGGVFGGDQVYLDGSNIFNSRPPFYNGATGYDSYIASPLGRVISVGIRAKF
jgi:iron complex outermembrane receptor protein